MPISTSSQKPDRVAKRIADNLFVFALKDDTSKTTLNLSLKNNGGYLIENAQKIAQPLHICLRLVSQPLRKS